MAGQDTSFSASTADAGIGTDGPEKVRAYVVHPDVRQTGARPEADGPAREKRSPEASLEEAVGLQAKMVLEVGHGSRYDSEYELVKLQAKRERRAREVDTILAQLDATLQAQAAAFAPHP